MIHVLDRLYKIQNKLASEGLFATRMPVVLSVLLRYCANPLVKDSHINAFPHSLLFGGDDQKTGLLPEFGGIEDAEIGDQFGVVLIHHQLIAVLGMLGDNHSSWSPWCGQSG